MGKQKILIAHGANIHAQDTNGQTPQDWIEKYNRSEIGELLVVA